VDDSFTYTPDALDPATGFYGADIAVFFNVFQQLVEFNATPSGTPTTVVPGLATNWSITDNYKTYIFRIRPNVTFSNGDPLTVYDVWFSFVRELYLGQAVGISNYAELTVNTSTLSTGLILPWGIRHAIQKATGLPATTNVNITESVLNNMLSNFNPDNSTQRAIMSYPDQAYVVLNSTTFEINLLVHYKFFLQDIAAWWGAIVDPAYVDAHGGVQANTANSYFDANGGPGTGPYEISSVGVGFTYVVLRENPTYWGLHSSDVPYVDKPPTIPVVIINYGLSHSERVEAFATNQAQVSFVNPEYFGQMYQAYNYKQYYSFNQIIKNWGITAGSGFNYVSMNTQIYPTNNNDFRLAIVHAINYTQLLYESYYYNGTLYGANYVGPINPAFPEYYNPGNLTLYSYNTRLAEYYLNLAGQQENFSVTLPNGTVIGDTSAPPLKPITIYYITPITPLIQTQLEIIQADLSAIGLSTGIQGVTPAVTTSWTTPQATPAFVYLGWGPDWPDPIFQLLMPAVTTTSYLPAWMNLSSVNQIMNVLPFLTNTSEQIQLVKEVYNITYWYAPYVWLPDEDMYLFVQPYVAGLYSQYNEYYYNTVYYTNT